MIDGHVKDEGGLFLGMRMHRVVMFNDFTDRGALIQTANVKCSNSLVIDCHIIELFISATGALLLVETLDMLKIGVLYLWILFIVHVSNCDVTSSGARLKRTDSFAKTAGLTRL